MPETYRRSQRQNYASNILPIPEKFYKNDYVLEPGENPIPAKYIADPSHAYLAPIPQSEMFLNPTWKQNPGYR
jgi:hypothetical protein